MSEVTKSRREREKEERKFAILAAAKKLIWEHGYSNTTMPKIAEAAELASGTLYLYFPSKECLYMELLSEGYDILYSQFEKLAGKKETTRQKTENVINVFLKFSREYSEYFDIIFFVLQSEGRGGQEAYLDSEQLIRMRAKENSCKKLVLELIQNSDTSGKVDVTLQKMEAIWSMLVGVIIFFRNDKKSIFDSVTAEAREIILKALFGSKNI